MVSERKTSDRKLSKICTTLDLFHRIQQIHTEEKIIQKIFVYVYTHLLSMYIKHVYRDVYTKVKKKLLGNMMNDAGFQPLYPVCKTTSTDGNVYKNT